jgi:hypothetical protein
MDVRGSDCQPLTIMPKGSIINSYNVDYWTVYMYIMGIVVSHRLTMEWSYKWHLVEYNFFTDECYFFRQSPGLLQWTSSMLVGWWVTVLSRLLRYWSKNVKMFDIRHNWHKCRRIYEPDSEATEYILHWQDQYLCAKPDNPQHTWPLAPSLHLTSILKVPWWLVWLGFVLCHNSYLFQGIHRHSYLCWGLHPWNYGQY